MKALLAVIARVEDQCALDAGLLQDRQHVLARQLIPGVMAIVQAGIEDRHLPDANYRREHERQSGGHEAPRGGSPVVVCFREQLDRGRYSGSSPGRLKR